MCNILASTQYLYATVSTIAIVNEHDRQVFACEGRVSQCSAKLGNYVRKGIRMCLQIDACVVQIDGISEQAMHSQKMWIYIYSYIGMTLTQSR